MSWDKYISKITTQPKNNNLHHMIDPVFWNINRLFNLSFKIGNNSTRNSFAKNYMSLVEIKDFKALRI